MQKFFTFLITRAAWLYLYWVGISSRIIWRNLEIRKSLEKEEKNFIYAFWHGRQFFIPWAYRNLGFYCLVSKSKDGEYISQVIHLFGLGTIRGSSSRGAAQALKELSHALKEGKTIGLTPDGPRGPQREVAPGILYIAQKTSKPILPLTYSAKYKIIFKGWDNYWIPLPFNTLVIDYGKPIYIGPKDDLKEKGDTLKKELDRMTQEADHYWNDSSREKIYYFLYNIFLKMGLPFILLGFLLKQPRRFFSQFFVGIGMRAGSLHKAIKQELKFPVWIHAASLGECRAAAPFIRTLKEQFPNLNILFTSNTLTGLEEAKKLELGDSVSFAPLDFPFILKRFFNAAQPKIFFMVESEIWPNRLRLLKKLGVKICLINGRISEKSTRKYLLSKSFSEIVLGKIDSFCVRETKDFERFQSLGIPKEKILITGNLKLDYFYFQQLTGIGIKSEEKNPLTPTDIVWTAASTRRGEEKIIIKTYLSLTHEFPHLKLILAPRHLEEVENIRHLLISNRLSFCLRNEFKNLNSKVSVIIWNTYGDLNLAYQWSQLVFMGGSFVPIGGHNPIEPSYFGKPVLFGPHMENFSEVVHLLKKSGGALEVMDSDSLLNTISNLLKDPKKLQTMGELGRRAIENVAGVATQKTFEFVKPHLIPIIPHA